MKTAAIVYDFPSLSQTFVLSQIEGLVQLGCDVRIFADGEDHSMPLDGPQTEAAMMDRVTYFGLPLRRIRESIGYVRSKYPTPPKPAPHSQSQASSHLSLRLKFEARAFKREKVFDVIHAHFGPNGVRAVRLREMGVISGPVITSFYGYDVGRPAARDGYPQLFSQGDLFLALGEQMRESLIDLGCPRDRTIVHRLGVDLDRFYPPIRVVTRQFEIVSIARLVPKKGIEYGLRAVAELVMKNVAFRYTIVGDGPLRARLERLSFDLGLDKWVRFVGALPNSGMPDLLKHSDVLLAPSVTAPDGDVEGTPVAVLEAHACGLPVVATRHAGIPEIVRDGSSGYLVAEGDHEGMAARLAELAGNPSLRRSMGDAGRAIVTENHDIRALNVELRQIYERVNSPTPA